MKFSRSGIAASSAVSALTHDGLLMSYVKTAKVLGLIIALSLLQRADQVIE